MRTLTNLLDRHLNNLLNPAHLVYPNYKTSAAKTEAFPQL